MTQGSATVPDSDEAAPPVLYDVTDSGVAVLTLNRPERLNAWGGGIGAAFYRLLDQAESDPAVRVIVVTGSGKAFCAGADMGDLTSFSGSLGDADGTDVGALVGNRHPYTLTQVRKPVIAAINGSCAGIGLTQALMCDIRFAAAGAKFTTSFARRALIAEYGISWILPRVVGTAVALDLLLSARVFYADEAAALGLVNDVVPADQLMAHTLAYAEDIANHCAPSALAVIKAQIYDDATQERSAASAVAETLMYESMRRPDLVEGITSFFERRPPSFPPLPERTQK